MQYIADLHLHSKYSRAVSQNMILPVMAEWGKKKGLDILTTGDWTHPLWLRHIEEYLEEKKEGLYKLKTSNIKSKIEHEPYFVLSTEISSIYSQGGKTRRIHNLIFSPNLETSQKISKELLKRGANLSSDGRPIIGLSSVNLLELVLSIDNNAFLIPCHAWTPWFSLYGSMSGFDSIEECFGNYSKYIFAIETGLSSDPEMNWRIQELGKRAIVSFSDAHSPAKMGREATVFELEDLSFKNLRRAIIGPYLKGDWQNLPDKIAHTIEFYPEEGKYHYTGHRNCNITQSPAESKRDGIICPVCKRPLTVGVMHRVEFLANQTANQEEKLDDRGVKWVYDKSGNHPPFVKLVPLIEIIAESFSMTVSSQKVKTEFETICAKLGSEMDILFKIEIEEIRKIGGERLAEAISKVRSGNIVIKPGYDGEYGVVKIWGNEAFDNIGLIEAKKKNNQSQLGIDF
jgi:uncharacterized protein (TIGR00375 family)